MKLNIMVIYEALSRNYTLCFVTCVDTNFAYSRPRLYTPGASLVENEIYVAEAVIFLLCQKTRVHQTSVLWQLVNLPPNIRSCL